MRSLICLTLFAALSPVVGFAEDAEEPPQFATHILPILKAKCLQCHSGDSPEAELSLQTVDDILRGGKSGPAVAPGRPVESPLLTMVSAGTMPMGGKPLSREEIALIRYWIESGARGSEPGGSGPAKAAGRVTEREVMATILGARCLPCHGRRRQEANLDLRTRESLLKGGKSGPAIVPGEPDDSLLVRRIIAEEMPPRELQEEFSVRGLTSDELERLRGWIAAGAEADHDEPVRFQVDQDPLVSETERRFWSFQAPRRPAVPNVKQPGSTPIDAFLLAKLETKRLGFTDGADRLTLMRRAYFDLIGLPPSPEEIESYLADEGADAYERLVDRLLASPHYGERWARYWLDAAGYADSEGAVSSDSIRPNAYHYRDHIIRSLNVDKPYDQFLIEQIAGDELFDYKAVDEYTPDQIDKLVATGFLRMGPDSTYSTEQNTMPERLAVVATQIEILTTSVMGLTMGCARCHDHKYDPLPQRDYYRLGAILQTAYDPYDWLSPNIGCIGVGANCDDSNTRLLPLRSSALQREVEEANAPTRKKIDELEERLEEKAVPLREQLAAEKLETLPEDVRKDVRDALEIEPERRTDVQKYLVGRFESALKVTREEIAERFGDFGKEAEQIQTQIDAEKKKLKPKPRIRALFDMGGVPTPTRILLRGEFTNQGPLVEPGVPSVLSVGLEPYHAERPDWHTETTGRRLALARWLTQPDHPLTARVMVNRIWQHHFSTGLVTTPGNFGSNGSRPTHPELLDWLATEFVQRGWSLKAMHRLIMTSSAYRQSSRAGAKALAEDPSNVLLSRFPLRRLDADALRDSILKVAGRLDTTRFGPADEVEVKPDGEVVARPTKDGYRRSIYILQRRSKPVTALETFDAPLLTPNCLLRPHSTVSSQALQLENSELVRDSARYMAGRVIDAAGDDVRKQIERVYWTTLSRPPTVEEAHQAGETLRELTREWRTHLESETPAEPIGNTARWLALSSLCHTYLNSAEFLYVN